MALEHAVAESPRGLIGAVGDQEVIAGIEDREKRGRNRRKPRWQQRNAGASGPFERAQRVFKCLRGGRPAPAVEVSRPAGKEILGGWIEHRRGVMDGRIDEAMVGGRVAAASHEPGCRLDGRMRGAAFGLLGMARFLCTASRTAAACAWS